MFKTVKNNNKYPNNKSKLCNSNNRVIYAIVIVAKKEISADAMCFVLASDSDNKHKPEEKNDRFEF